MAPVVRMVTHNSDDHTNPGGFTDGGYSGIIADVDPPTPKEIKKIFGCKLWSAKGINRMR